MSAPITESDLRRLADAYREHAPAGVAAAVFAMLADRRDAVLRTVRDNAAHQGLPVETFLAQMRPDEPRKVRESAPVASTVVDTTTTAEADFDALARGFAAKVFRGADRQATEHAAATTAVAERHPQTAVPAGFDAATARREHAARVFGHLDRPAESGYQPASVTSVMTALKHAVDAYDDPCAAGRG